MKKHQPFLIFLIAVTYLCNLFDLWYTFYALDFGRNTYEANPAYRVMLEHPYLAVVYKYAVLPLLLYLLYKLRDRLAARLGLYLCAAFFIGNTVYQLLTLSLWAW